jgi:hypothetical protein
LFQVFETTAADLEADLSRRTGGGGDGGEIGEDAVVKLRGLPFSASKMDIVDFFKAGLAIKNPPKKTHLKKLNKNGFFGFFNF